MEVQVSDSCEVLVHSGAEIVHFLGLFDSVVLRQPLGRELPLVHVDSLGLGNQIAGWIAAKCWAPGKRIVGFHPVSVVSPYSLRSPGRRLDFVRRSSISVRGGGGSVARLRAKPTVGADTYIDLRRRVLYLSLEIINRDPDIFKPFGMLNRNALVNELSRNLGLRAPDHSQANGGRSLGVHFRQGDFAVPQTETIDWQANTRIPLEQHLEAVSTALTQTGSRSIEVFSDGSLSRDVRSQLSRRAPGGIRFHSKWDSARRTFVKMLGREYLLVGNSTLSFWAAVLGDGQGVRLLRGLPVPNPDHFRPFLALQE